MASLEKETVILPTGKHSSNSNLLSRHSPATLMSLIYLPGHGEVRTERIRAQEGAAQAPPGVSCFGMVTYLP